jgi:hypothetical protein
MKTSSLSSRSDRSTDHLRWTKTTDGWGGDEEVVLASIDTFKSRIEQVEGVGDRDRWNVWVFDSTVDLQVEDILLYITADLALVIQKIAPFTKLSGSFHHYELLTEEHEHSRSTLLAAIP